MNAAAHAATQAIAFRNELIAIVHRRGATLRLGFKGRFAHLQAQWPGAEDALRLLRTEAYGFVHYLTEAEETADDDDEPSRPQRLQAERLELAFNAVEMRSEIDALCARLDARPRLTSDGKRAWVCVRVAGEWIPVIRCRKGQPPESFDLLAAMTTARPDVASIRRGERRTNRQRLSV